MSSNEEMASADNGFEEAAKPLYLGHRERRRKRFREGGSKSFTDQIPARAASDHVLSWRAIRVIMAHGHWQRTDRYAFFKRALSWLGN